MRSFLNYQGNKSRLIGFIDSYLPYYFQPQKKLLDIFSGGASISRHYYNQIAMASNDIEIYSYHLANATYSQGKKSFDAIWHLSFEKYYHQNLDKLKDLYEEFLYYENNYIHNEEIDNLINLYSNIPTIWNNHYSKITNRHLKWSDLVNVPYYCLMTTHYSTSYFGLLQCIELDSIKYAIDKTLPDYNISYLYSVLYGAMSQSVFSKDGHMAQPLSLEKNRSRLLKCRNNDIFEIFKKGVNEYEPDYPIYDNEAFNFGLNDFLHNDSLLDNVGCIYADPPYTDMQYSRYYHLLTTITKYEYCEPTIKYGKYTSGLYLNNRNQSELSTRKNCLNELKKLMVLCKKKHINLCISFAYPDDVSDEKNDRYTMDIKDLISSCRDIFTSEKVEVERISFEHANHRNTHKKEVFEYLICCRGNA